MAVAAAGVVKLEGRVRVGGKLILYWWEQNQESER
jgi:hypothetical protein